MARYVLAILAAAVLCTAVAAQEVTPAHKGGDQKITDRVSSFDSASKRYRPVKCGKNLCLYRIKALLVVDTYHRNQPDPATFATTVAVYTGRVLEIGTNATTGTFEVSGIATTQPAGPTDTLNIIETHVFEFGPNNDDALTVTGNSQVSPATLSITDSDMAVTGGTGQFLGAYGSFTDRSGALSSNTVSVADITIYVPNNKL
uniref:Dirigent protein n=1 Tax=Tetradesmus obliquus TaxID=3088 RepID=A0A383VX44_TETOB|eukprot:jgi/Sobl393_1/11467/SZX69429.1